MRPHRPAIDLDPRDAASRRDREAHGRLGVFRGSELQRELPVRAAQGRRDGSPHGRHHRVDRGQVTELRQDLVASPGRTDRRHAGDVLRHHGERAAAPRMVVGAAAAHVFRQRGDRPLDHAVVPLADAVQGALGFAHEEQRLEHVFLHVRARVAVAGQHLAQGGELVRTRQSRHNGQPVAAVVGVALVPRRAVFAPVPELRLNALLDGGHAGVPLGDIVLRAGEQGHVDRTLEGQVVPHAVQQGRIDVLAPVRPVPVPGAMHDEAVGVEAPDAQVVAHVRIGRTDRLRVAGIQVIEPEAVPADAGQHLRRQFLVPVAGGHGGEKGLVRSLPVDQFQNALARQVVGRRIEHIEGLAELIDRVAPPLGAFAVGAVHVIVTHRDIQRAPRLLPQRVQERVVAREGAGEFRVVARLAELQGPDLHAGGNRVVHLVPVHPARRFMGLHPFPRDVLGVHVRLAAAAQVVGADPDREPRRRLDLQIGRDVRVVGQARLDDGAVADGGQVRGIHIRPEAEILPERNGPPHEPAPRRRRRHAALDRRVPRGVVKGRRRPAGQILSRIKADARFRQPVVGLGVARRAEGGMNPHLPGAVGDEGGAAQLRFKHEPRPPAVLVGEALPAEIPHEYGDAIRPPLQIRRQIERIVIAVGRRRPTLESAFTHDQCAVDPQPVLGIHRDAGGHRGRHAGQHQRLAVPQPLVGLAAFRADPLRGPRSLHGRRRRPGRRGATRQTRQADACDPQTPPRPRSHSVSPVPASVRVPSDAGTGRDFANAGRQGDTFRAPPPPRAAPAGPPPPHRWSSQRGAERIMFGSHRPVWRRRS